MDSATGEEPLPGPTDLERWRQAVASGRFAPSGWKTSSPRSRTSGPTPTSRY